MNEDLDEIDVDNSEESKADLRNSSKPQKKKGTKKDQDTLSEVSEDESDKRKDREEEKFSHLRDEAQLRVPGNYLSDGEEELKMNELVKKKYGGPKMKMTKVEPKDGLKQTKLPFS